MEEEEHIQYEEEEFTTIYRKTKRTKNTTRRKHPRTAEHSGRAGTPVRTEIKLNPFIHGTKGREVHKPGPPEEGPLKADYVQRLVKDTLRNPCKGSSVGLGADVGLGPELSPVQRPNRLFLGQFDSDDAEDEDDDEEEEDEAEKAGKSRDGEYVEEEDLTQETITNSCTVWRCKKTGRQGFDRFRRMVEFVILAQHVFTVRRSVHLNRRDSILFFMDTDSGKTTDDGDSKPKFDVNAFRGIGQKTKTASIKSCLDVPPAERTDAQVNQMVHLMKHFTKFSSYPQAVQTGICRQGWYAKYESSKVLVKEGCRAEFYYLILSGLAVYRDDSPVDGSSNQPVTSYLRPGDTLGEREILTDCERPATVVCKEDVEVLGVDRDTLVAIFEASGGLRSIDYLKKLPELSDFPLELLQTYHFSMSVHYYRRGTVIVKDSHNSEWIYIVRSGSCQVYKTVHESQKARDPLTRVSSKPVKRGSSDSSDSRLVLPDISRSKNETLRCASTDNINDILKKKNKIASLERSLTVLPNLVPGKTTLVSQRPDSRLCNTPTLPQINHHKDTPKKKKPSSASQKNSRKKHSDCVTPDIMRSSKNRTSNPETPDSPRLSSRGNLYSASVENAARLFMKKGKRGSNDSAKQLYTADCEHETGSPKERHMYPDETMSPRDMDGHVAYVRLDVVVENGVFGLHPLVYDSTPNLSLVSNGAECVLVSKKFLRDHLEEHTVKKLKTLLTPYPGPDQLRHALDHQANWDSYRGKVVDDVVLS